MSWLFAFAGLAVVALVAFAHVGLRAARCAVEPATEATGRHRVVRPWFGPTEWHLPDGRMWLLDSDWFDPTTGRVIDRQERETAYYELRDQERRDLAARRARKYGAAR